MSGFGEFLLDPKVHDTALLTMLVSSLLAALRRFKVIDNTPIAPGLWAKIKLLWNFVFDWMTGFWSMKQGQPVHPTNETHIETSTQTPDGSATQKATFISGPDPLPAAGPSETK